MRVWAGVQGEVLERCRGSDEGVHGESERRVIDDDEIGVCGRKRAERKRRGGTEQGKVERAV